MKLTAKWLNTQASKAVTEMLVDADYKVYFVGGCVVLSYSVLPLLGPSGFGGRGLMCNNGFVSMDEDRWLQSPRLWCACW